MANRPKRSGLCLLAGFTLAVLLQCEIQSASANETDTGAVSERFVSLIREFQKRVVDANALVSSEAPVESKPAPQSTRKPGSAKGPYYVDFRARTAASWGHAFVWYGKTSERQVEVAGLTPAGDTLAYVVGYLTWVPSETGASYGDLDPEYLTAQLPRLLERAGRKEGLRLHQEIAGEFTGLECRNIQLHFVYRQHRKFYGIESSLPLAAS